MGQGTNVETEALRRYADAAEDAAERVRRVRRRTSGLSLSDGVFGQLPEANDLRAGYLEQMEQSGDDLMSSAEALGTVAEAMRSSADNCDTNEDDTARGFGGRA
ncbi:hypothetical protein GTY65_18110 [Streptomyces sp. SID8379]|uniref:hypothetical protein n=1 Tax=unclassified Streptomyces TaxID=2593676 RepID=UPI00036FE452|nr:MULTISPECIES: hypothetical protein [unclassified Streptomyces]MYW65955.1 hypothetical protein [Streptomyces sp. SID8379]